MLLRSNYKDKNNMNGKYGIKITSSVQVISSEKYISETQHKEFKETVINFIKEV